MNSENERCNTYSYVQFEDEDRIRAATFGDEYIVALSAPLTGPKYRYASIDCQSCAMSKDDVRGGKYRQVAFRELFESDDEDDTQPAPSRRRGVMLIDRPDEAREFTHISEAMPPLGEVVECLDEDGNQLGYHRYQKATDGNCYWFDVNPYQQHVGRNVAYWRVNNEGPQL